MVRSFLPYTKLTAHVFSGKCNDNYRFLPSQFPWIALLIWVGAIDSDSNFSWNFKKETIFKICALYLPYHLPVTKFDLGCLPAVHRQVVLSDPDK